MSVTFSNVLKLIYREWLPKHEIIEKIMAHDCVSTKYLPKEERFNHAISVYKLLKVY